MLVWTRPGVAAAFPFHSCTHVPSPTSVFLLRFQPFLCLIVTFVLFLHTLSACAPSPPLCLCSRSLLLLTSLSQLSAPCAEQTSFLTCYCAPQALATHLWPYPRPCATTCLFDRSPLLYPPAECGACSDRAAPLQPSHDCLSPRLSPLSLSPSASPSSAHGEHAHSLHSLQGIPHPTRKTQSRGGGHWRRHVTRCGLQRRGARWQGRGERGKSETSEQGETRR